MKHRCEIYVASFLRCLPVKDEDGCGRLTVGCAALEVDEQHHDEIGLVEMLDSPIISSDDPSAALLFVCRGRSPLRTRDRIDDVARSMLVRTLV